MTGRPPVALAHDNLASRAGGERVLCALAAEWPNAPIHTLIHAPDATFSELGRRRIRASRWNRIPLLRRHYRAALPIAAMSWSARTIDADVTLCSSSGLSHHVRTTGAKVVYCHTPARWLHDQGTYLRGFGAVIRNAAKVLAGPLGVADRRAMCAADRVLANSSQIADEINAIYGIDATVVRPCSALDLHGPVVAIDGVEPGFVVAPVRPLGYKRLDVLFEAARRRPELRVLHIGDGPHREELVSSAPANVRSVGSVDDAQLRWAYRNARAAVLTCAEDFGLVPLEASAHGLATVAPDARGIRDHDPATVCRYEFGSTEALLDALDRAAEPTGRLDEQRLGRARFTAQVRAAVAAASSPPSSPGARLDRRPWRVPTLSE